MFSSQALLRTRLQSQLLMRLRSRASTPASRLVSALSAKDDATRLQVFDGTKTPTGTTTGFSQQQVPKQKDKPATTGCADEHEPDNNDDDDDDEMEQEEMFVEAHESFEHRMLEWGGPRRGGRFPEPTRFGDWERKGRCTDF